jgi:hypothetical protein
MSRCEKREAAYARIKSAGRALEQAWAVKNADEETSGRDNRAGSAGEGFYVETRRDELGMQGFVQ